MDIQSEMDKEQEAKSPQSLERAEIASFVWQQYHDKKNIRDQEQDLFRGRTLKKYIDDNVKRFVQFKKRPAHKRNWQSNLASTTPNEKLIGILSKLALQGIESKAISTQELNNVEFFKERISNYLIKHAAYKNDDDFQIILEMLEAAEKGIVIGFEDWYYGDVKRKEVTKQNPETGELEYKEKNVKEWNDVRSMLVNIEDFVPGDIYVRPGCIQDMDECYLRTIMTKDEFLAEFGGYPDADLVETQSSTIVNESTPFWKNSEDVSQDKIEVVRKFDKKNDEMVILANEIWINAKGDKIVAPLPWNHKKLPFWANVFEPLDSNYFYGRSMIDKLIADCDAKDALFDRILDQATLSVSRPILSDGQTSSAMTKGFLQPNNVITTDWSDGKPKFDIVPIPEPSSASVSLYQILNQRNEQSSIPAENLAGGSSRQKTATQVEIEQQGANDIVSLFLKMMEKGIKDKNVLRFSNQIQFYSMPSTKGEYKRVVLRDQKLNNGQNGAIQISVVNKLKGGFEKDSLEHIENIEIEPKALRNMKMDIKIVPQSSIKMTETQRQILELNYQRVMNELYQDKFDRDYGFDQLNRKFGKDTNQARAKQPQQIPGQPGQPGGQPAKPTQLSPVPQPQRV